MSITSVYLGAWSPGVTWDNVQAADINGDGKTDIVGRVDSSGAWYAGIATGSGTAMSLTTVYLGVLVAVGDVDQCDGGRHQRRRQD